MKRRSVELERREWLTEGDAQRVAVATLTWCPTDRVNGYPARYLVQFGNVRRYVADFLGEYLERYGLSIDADAPSACVP